MEVHGKSAQKDIARNILICGGLPSLVVWAVILSGFVGRFDLAATALGMVAVGGVVGWWGRGLMS